MWILECDGDVLGGKRRWLKPGSRWHFGRNQVEDPVPNEFSFGIQNKTISRKHLVLDVAPISSGEDAFTRSTITMTDDSKIGTEIDGLTYTKTSHVLENKQHIFRLGRAEINFTITWIPITFTFHLRSKLNQYAERFESLDIAAIEAYVTSETSHVIADKRNIPKALRALVNGKHLVTPAFVDAVEEAATTGTAGSPLERDFDANWPKEADFLPPPATEPHPRPAEIFKPDAQRQSLFQGFTFIFATQIQWDSLHQTVLDGGAKALKYDLEMGVTKVEDFVQYVLDAAEKKGLRSLGDTTQAKGVVFVRPRAEGDLLEWSLRFIESVDAQLEQRSIEQNEFLDAILTLDVSKLRQPLQEAESQDMEGTRVPPSTAARTTGASRSTTIARTGRQSPQPSQSAAQEQGPVSQAPRTAASQLRARRVITTSRFKGFDDFDASQFSRRKSQVQEIDDEDDEEEVEAAPSQSQAQSIRRRSATNNDSQSLFISDSQDAPSQPNNTQYSTSSTNPRKRRAPASPSPSAAPEDEDDAYDAMFPAAAAMKKRRLEDEAAGRSKTNLSQAAKDAAASKTAAAKAKPKKAVKELDVRNAARIRAEALDAQREGSDKQEINMTEEEIAAFRPDFKMAELSLRERRDDTIVADDDRMDPRWVGRKNFKKFVKSRPGATNNSADGTGSFVVNNRARKVIVTLEEAKRKTYGLGEEDYFLEPGPKQRRGHSQSQSQARSQPKQKQKRNTQLDATTNVTSADEQEADDDIEPEEIAGQPREGPVAAALRRLGGDDVETQTQTTQTQTSAARKRAAPATESAPPGKMRSGSARVPVATRRQQDGDEDDSEEEVKFKLRRPVRG